MNVLLLCRKFKKDKSMKKGRFSLLGIVALFLGLILVSCSDDDDQGGVIDTGIKKTRSHTDNFGENNVKCLIAKGICRFVPHSSAGGF